MSYAPSGSLEDCFTNVSALTELSGLKWRRLTTVENYVYDQGIDKDPILSAFAQCVKTNVLCTWRRRPHLETASTSSSIATIQLSVNTAKELWIFWYSNDEPEIIKKLLDSGLIVPDELDQDLAYDSIKYETRTLYFKALHNQMERNMLKRGFVRFGRWFTRPLDESAVAQDCPLPAYIMGVRYEFMVLGENHVCTMIKSQLQQPILRLSAKHLRSTEKQTVILGPWSLKAVLLPNQPLRQLQNLNGSNVSNSSVNSSGFSLLDAGLGQQTPEEVQQAIQQSWDEWRRVITLPTNIQSDDEETEERENISRSKRRIDDENSNGPTATKKKKNTIPKFVLVEVDGIKMFYPSCYVGIVASDLRESSKQERSNQVNNNEPDLHDSLVGFSETSQLGLLEKQKQMTSITRKRETFVPDALRHSRKSYVGVRIGRRSFEDACITAPSLSLPMAPTTNPSIGLNSGETENPNVHSNAFGPPPIQRGRSETGLHLNMPSTSSALPDDLRQWNYFDYQRREMCYCKNCSPSAVPVVSTDPKYVFHRANFSDRHSETLHSPHQPQKTNPSVPIETLQKELEYLKKMEENEEREHNQHRRVPIFSRVIGKRNSITSNSLNFMGANEPDFRRIMRAQFDELHEKFDPDVTANTNSDFEQFTPVTSITPDLSEDESGNTSLYHDSANFAFDPRRRDTPQKSCAYHVSERRDKPIGPPVKESSATTSAGSHRTANTTVRSNQTSNSTRSALRKALDEIDDCAMPSKSAKARRDEEDVWFSRLAQTTYARWRPCYRRDQSKREKDLQQRIEMEMSKNQRSYLKDYEAKKQDSRRPSGEQSPNSRSLSEDVHPLQSTRSIVGKSIPERLNEPMDFEGFPNRRQTAHLVNRGDSFLNRQSCLSAPNLYLSWSDNDLMVSECSSNEIAMDKHAPLHRIDRFLDSTVGHQYRFLNKTGKSQHAKNKTPIETSNRKHELNEYSTLRQAMQEDLADVEDPKTPITNLNSSLSSNSASHQHSHETQQMFTSAQSLENTVHSILSPPASNEQAESLMSQQTQPLAGQHAVEKANVAAQQLVPIGNNLLLHSSGWNTNSVPTSTAHDSLNIIYPTPPTPMQQFSPQNALATSSAAGQQHANSDEPTTSKRRRLISAANGIENSELHEEDETSSVDRGSDNEERIEDDDENSERSNKDFVSSGFLSMDDLATEVLFPSRSRSISPVYFPKLKETPPLVSERYVGDLLDADVEPKRKLRWLKHLKKEPAVRRQNLKQALKRRAQRTHILQPPDYLRYLEKQRRMAEQERRHFGLNSYNVSKKNDILRDPLERLVEDALDLNQKRKPIFAYGCAAAARLNKIYVEKKKREMERQQRMADAMNKQQMPVPHPAMIRQFSADGMTSGYPPHMQQNPMMMHGQQRPNYNPYMHPQYNQAQQQMMMQGVNGPYIPGQVMPMNRNQVVPSYGSQQQQMMMQNAGVSPNYPQMMHHGSNQNYPQPFRPPFMSPQQQQQLHMQQMMLHQQRMGGHGSPMGAVPTPPQQPVRYGQFAPSPASSIGSNQPVFSQHQMNSMDQTQLPNVQRPGSVAPASNSGALMQRPGSTTNMMTAPSPFGSPATVQNPVGSVGANFAAQRTPSMPPSVPVDTRNVFSVENSLVGHRSDAEQTKIDEVLSIFQTAKSRNIAVLMQDTVVDLFYDTVFDACPICSCNVNIRSSELGLYINVSASGLEEINIIQQRQQQDPNYRPDYWNGLMASVRGTTIGCSCGFSAVRHRYLCGSTGLFFEDIREASGFSSLVKKSNEQGKQKNQKNIITDLADCLRSLSISRNWANAFYQAYYLGDIPDSLERPLLHPDLTGKPTLPSTNVKTDYVVSRMDCQEVSAALGASVESSTGRMPTKRIELLHSWGYQLANGIREPKDQEYLAVVREVQGVLEHAMKEVRGIDTTSQTSIVEGPLTLRSIHKKAVKSSQDDDSYRPEQIPQILVSADRDPIATNPQLVHMWEKLTMGPYDQAKDVLYIAVVPDSTVIVEKCKIFLEELSTVYEKCRFGRHVKLATRDAPRNGIVRVSMRTQTTGQESLNKQGEEERRLGMRVSAYCDAVLHELQSTITMRDQIFERRAYYETLYRDSLQPSFTTLASSSDDTNMPPPQGIRAPASTGIGAHASPSSVLSSTSGGPASAQASSMGSSLFVGNVQNSSCSPAVHAHDGTLIEPLRTPEAAIGTPQQIDQRPPSVQSAPAPTQPIQLSPEAVEKAVDEMLSEDHALALPHVIVIYLVNPFTFGSEAFNHRAARHANIILTKMFNSFLSMTRHDRRPQIQLELINLQTLYDYTAFASDPLREDRQLLEATETAYQEKASAHDCLRRIAFSVYSQTRLLLPEHVRKALAPSMTRFGPASSMTDTLDELRNLRGAQQPLYFRVPTAPFVLAPMEVIGVEGPNQKIRLLNSNERVLFVSYCLTEDDFLCAAVTDQNGHLADNVLINLHVNPIDPNGPPQRYKNRSQINDGIQRLWQWIQSVMIMETRNWRLVISRVGKIGHGEFKAWSQILSKPSLRAFNSTFRARDRGEQGLVSAGLSASFSSASNCRACAATCSTQELPIVLSACLLSMEAEPNLRLFISSAAAMDAAVSKSKVPLRSLSSIDSSITHIIAFPVSPDISTDPLQHNQNAAEEDNLLFNDICMDDTFGNDEFRDLVDATELNDGLPTDVPIDHQPMAVGYVVSTAGASELPSWFWNTCPNAKRHLPVHLKNALHINSSNVHEELQIGGKSGEETYHPLDESATDSLLKHVMKMHNALSWLNVDVANGSRHSCLPVHMQVLFRLYRTIQTINS
ncbi:Mediator of RNA polymerase II transcription subunit 13 [Aphelenchoides besseyi]|nr:Mediator of RNA polymerase II transcription subunit 13 [Aphelenchoides besseyi]